MGPDCFSAAWQLPGGSPPTNGSIPIAGTFLAFSAPAADVLSLIPQAASFSFLSATGAVDVVANGPWSVQLLDPWISLLSDTNCTGNGRISYAVALNATAAMRAGTIVVNGHTHSVIQEAGPVIAISVSTNNSLQLVLRATALQTFVLEASNDLAAWEPIYTNNLPATVDVPTVDRAFATAPVRFYRAVMK